jgi:DNA polymerase III subunit epsilon
MTIPSGLSELRQSIIQQAHVYLDQKPVFLDTETTGLDRTAEAVEISLVDFDGSILFQSLVRPSRPIPPETTRIHHITNAMVEKAPTWPVLWPTLRGLLLGRSIAIYNEEFDVRIMKQSHGVYRLPWRENLKTFCVMQMYARFRGDWDPMRRGYRLHSLENAGKHCQISLPNSHRAADDCLLTRALLFHMAGVTPENYASSSPATETNEDH